MISNNINNSNYLVTVLYGQTDTHNNKEYFSPDKLLLYNILYEIISQDYSKCRHIGEN